MSKSKSLSLIVAALLPQWGIGYKNALPWRLRNEMKYFKTVTSTAPQGQKNAVIMGKNTWESIPHKFRPLPNRLNVIISTTITSDNTQESVHYYSSLEKALAALALMDEVHRVFIMGGAQLYNYCLHKGLVSDLLITEVSCTDPVAMDTFLDKEFILEHYQRAPEEALHTNLGFVPQGKQTEGEYEYEYTLYTLR